LYTLKKKRKQKCEKIRRTGVATVVYWFFDHDGVIFFWFLPKWGPFKKNYKFRQVVPDWDDFICRSRTN